MVNMEAKRQSQGGFTLVELAIVMVIIGLLIGGILKGQELIANAQIASTVSQIKSVDAAMNAFIDKYNGYPGDLRTPGNRLPNCGAGTPCNTQGTGGTIGNSRIEGGNVSTAPTEVQESGKMFVQLSAADLVSGLNVNDGAVFGGIFPTVKAGGGMWVAYAGATLATSLPAGKHYAALAGINTGAVTTANGALNAAKSAQIDRKLDDGMPNTGSMQVVGSDCASSAAVTGVYSETTDGGTCTIYTRVLN